MIYLVIGASGQYDEYRSWPVKAFTVKASAERFVTFANRRATELYREYSSLYNKLGLSDPHLPQEEWNSLIEVHRKKELVGKSEAEKIDPNMSLYDATWYKIQEIELVTE